MVLAAQPAACFRLHAHSCSPGSQKLLYNSKSDHVTLLLLTSLVAPHYPYREVVLLTRALSAPCATHVSLLHPSLPTQLPFPPCCSLCPGVCRSPFLAPCRHLLSLPRPSPAAQSHSPFLSVPPSSCRPRLHVIELFVCVSRSSPTRKASP